MYIVRTVALDTRHFCNHCGNKLWTTAARRADEAQGGDHGQEMTYWIREFEHADSKRRFRVYSNDQYLPALRRRVARYVDDQDWLDDQIVCHDASLDMRRDGECPLHVDGLRLGEMPLKTAEQIEQECLRLLRMNWSTRDIRAIKIVAIETKGTEPNWTCLHVDPEPTIVGIGEAREIIASVAGRWALAA